MVMRYFPLIASAAFLAADSFPVSATYQNSSLQIFSGSQINQPSLFERSVPQMTIPFHRNNNLLEQLDFSFEQTMEIQQISSNYQTIINQKQQKLFLAQKELVKLIKEDDLQLIRAKHQEILQLRQTLDQLNFESLLAIREVLTPSQRQEFTQIMESRQVNSQQN
ncbi:hypothetical protein Sta7437_3841 [Stanieria cyanosphaera PCC 7437]|uniref:Periplasmic heavy metal sensor n=1 Tax=Stanieria cyanosphaera (strain ATCC 29371 / PCC 7437) TaxID=111780 RepID=K9Y057_STAC7|nr:hypothetical protein [Stanieria cyanosphaera]AFZ37327.1 hypothetical protein Sta7437_3841 [Stanieria cyanosphaera PCC 7437]